MMKIISEVTRIALTFVFRPEDILSNLSSDAKHIEEEAFLGLSERFYIWRMILYLFVYLMITNEEGFESELKVIEHSFKEITPDKYTVRKGKLYKVDNDETYPNVVGGIQ